LYGVGFGAALLGVGAYAAIDRTRKRKPATPHRCVACHIEMSSAEDFCPTCRHEAAEAVRRAAAVERALAAADTPFPVKRA
jgi:rRNA maturation endonuclease Nob1